MDNIKKLFDNDDPRITALTCAIRDVIYERSAGLIPLATVLGALEIVKTGMIQDATDDMKGSA